MANAYEIMRGWDQESGIKPRTNFDFDIDVPGSIAGDYDAWKAALESGDPEAIAEGRSAWDLPLL